MKFEFVEFYPNKLPNKKKSFLGTVHIYAIECELDFRGIAVTKHGRGIFFNFPHFKAVDDETGLEVRYPHLRFTNEAKHKEMMDFLHQTVKPLILQRMGTKTEKKPNT